MEGFHLEHIHIGQQVEIDLAPVVDRIPKAFFKLFCFTNTADSTIVLDPEQDHPAVGVGHGAVGLPQALRQSAPSRFELQIVVFRPIEPSQDVHRIDCRNLAVHHCILHKSFNHPYAEVPDSDAPVPR